VTLTDQFYQINVIPRPINATPGSQDANTPNLPGTIPTPGGPIVIGPTDAPVDNFMLAHNFIQAYGQVDQNGAPIPYSGRCMSAPFSPYDPMVGAAGSDPRCWSPQYYESTLGKNRQAGTYPSFSDSEIWGVSANIEYDFGFAEFVSISAYRELDSQFQRDTDMTPLDIAVTIDDFQQWQFSQEFQLKGTSFGDRLNWILGAYYFKEKVDNLNDVLFTPVNVRSGGIIDNKSIALFGQGTFSITEQLKLTGGLRWTKDDKTFESGPYQYVLLSKVGPGYAYGFDACPNAATSAECTVDPNGIPQDGPLTVYQRRDSEQKAKELTPYVNLSYQWTDDFMTYASFSKGFKSGGFTQRVFPPQAIIPSVGPEKVTVYEAGFKSSFLDRRVRFNAAAFYTDYKDLQIQGFTPETGIAPVYTNAASARVQGFEAELAISPGSGWFIEAGLGYLDPKYKRLSPDAALFGLTLDSDFERVSKWSVTAAVQKDFDLGDDIGTVRPRLDWSYRSRFYNDASNIDQIAQPGYSVFNTTVTFLSPEEKWTLTGGVNNLFDKDFIHSAIWNTATPFFNVVPTRGREWYLRAAVNF
jgi:iron complex outermembrane recepter protein